MLTVAMLMLMVGRRGLLVQPLLQQLDGLWLPGGLAALEKLGRGTMTTLERHDPGLKRTRAVLQRGGSSGSSSQNLSSALREAAEKAQQEDNLHSDSNTPQEKSFETMFSELHGSMHMEALELLAAQCEPRLLSRLSSMHGKRWRTLRQQLDRMRQLLEISDEDDEDEEDEDEKDEDILLNELEKIDLKPLTNTEIVIAAFHILGKDTDPVKCLAVLTAAAVHQLHRIGQAAMQHGQLVSDWISFCTQLMQMVRLLRQMAAHIAHRASAASQQHCEPRQLTAVLLEAAHSRGCIQDTAMRLVPVLQFASLPSTASSDAN